MMIDNGGKTQQRNKSGVKPLAFLLRNHRKVQHVLRWTTDNHRSSPVTEPGRTKVTWIGNLRKFRSLGVIFQDCRVFESQERMSLRNFLKKQKKSHGSLLKRMI